MFKKFLITGAAVLLSACGGGGSDTSPIVLEIKAKNLLYGQTVSLLIAGKFLRNSLIADTGSCTNPTFSSSSTPDLATVNCKVTAVGLMPVIIKSASGEVLNTSTFNVLPPQVTLFTTSGNIVMELNAAVVPATVNNFLNYVSSGYYYTTIFHRVIPGFVVQGGGYTSGVVAKTGLNAPIALESNKGLSNTRGTVAMARTTVADSATSQFFFNLADNHLKLDYQDATNPGYAVFGTVVKGMDVVDAIAAAPTGTVGGVADVPITDVTITYAVQTQ